jgi:hypothetical protein
MCRNGVCILNCMGNRMACGGVCVDTNADDRNCGACGVMCPLGKTCRGGTCK